MANDTLVYKTVPKDEKFFDSCIPHATPQGFGVRHLQTLLLFISLTVGLSMRAQLSVLMVAIADTNVTDNCNVTIDTNTTIVNQGGICNSIKNISNWSVYRTYNWNKSTQEIITFAFFVGYTSMQLPMGLLAQKYGGKIPIMVALGVNGIVSILMPWIALIGGWVAVTASRCIQGLTQAAFYPSIHTILARWAPVSERGRLSNYAYSGSQFGTILAFQISGLLAGSPTFGWPASFWLFGALSLVICGIMGWLGAATPHEHPNISTEELTYILDGGNADVVPKTRKTPWKDILKCRAIWGLIIAQCGSTGGYLLILTEIPLYMNGVLHVDIKRNGLYSSLPYIAMYLMSLLFGNMVDYLRNKNFMKVVNIRRTFNTIGSVISGLFLVAFGFTNNTLLAVILLILALGSHSGVHCGFLINSIDLAPNFAGSIMALGNMLGNLISLLVPVVVSSIVSDVKNQREWQIVFIIFTSIFFISNTIFVVFARDEVQAWNFYGEEEEESDRKTVLVEVKKTNKEDEINKNENNKSVLSQ